MYHEENAVVQWLEYGVSNSKVVGLISENCIQIKGKLLRIKMSAKCIKCWTKCKVYNKT